MKRLRKDPVNACAAIYIDDGGVMSIEIRNDDTTRATRTHELLAQVTDELRALHLGLAAAAVRQSLEDRASAVATAVKEGESCETK